MEPPTTRAVAPKPTMRGPSATPGVVKASSRTRRARSSSPAGSTGDVAHVGGGVAVAGEDRPAGDGVLQWSAVDPGEVHPALGRCAGTGVADAAVGEKRGADTGAERDAHGTAVSVDGAHGPLAGQEGVGVVEEHDVAGALS